MIFNSLFHHPIYLDSLSNSLREIFRSLGIVISIRRHVLLLWSLMTISNRLAWIDLSVFIGKSHRIVVFSPSTTGAVLCSYHLSACGVW